jgi:hypothetical protein
VPLIRRLLRLVLVAFMFFIVIGLWGAAHRPNQILHILKTIWFAFLALCQLKINRKTHRAVSPFPVQPPDLVW